MRYLVTGAAGFIGSHLAERLVAEGQEVWSLDNYSTGSEDNVLEGVERLPFDGWGETIVDRGILFDAVFHLAARASVPFSMNHPHTTHGSGPTLTLQLLEMCRHMGVPKFVFASSSSVYGHQTQVTRESPLRPASPYAASKAAGEMYCRAYSNLFAVGILRYFNVFGPRQRAGALIPELLRAVSLGQTFTIHGDGSQFRYFCHVDNVVAANLTAVRRIEVGPPLVENIRDDEAHTVRDVALRVAALTGSVMAASYTEPRAGDVHGYRCDEVPLFDYRVVSFDAGLQSLIDKQIK